jgi:FAD/FMN-containing dehydrogenase
VCGRRRGAETLVKTGARRPEVVADAAELEHTLRSGVVIPRDEDDAVSTVELCRQHDAPIVARGGGTSLAGQTCNVAVVIDFSAPRIVP